MKKQHSFYGIFERKWVKYEDDSKKNSSRIKFTFHEMRSHRNDAVRSSMSLMIITHSASRYLVVWITQHTWFIGMHFILVFVFGLQWIIWPCFERCGFTPPWPMVNWFSIFSYAVLATGQAYLVSQCYKQSLAANFSFAVQFDCCGTLA